LEDSFDALDPILRLNSRGRNRGEEFEDTDEIIGDGEIDRVGEEDVGRLSVGRIIILGVLVDEEERSRCG
jgi:hypothetical protein